MHVSEEHRAAPTSASAKRAGRPKGGRPKTAPPDARRAVVQALLTEAERDAVRRAADDSGLTVSAYARRRLLGRPVAPLVDGRAQRELNRIGVNLNGLVRAAVQRLGRSTVEDASEGAQ